MTSKDRATTPVSDLLFREAVEGCDRPLFKNVFDLAREIAAHKKLRKNQVKSLGNHLAQIVVYKTRTCSEDRQREMFDAVVRRLDSACGDAAKRDSFMTKLRHAFEALNLSRIPKPLSSDDLFLELQTLAYKCEEQFVITPKPAERQMVQSRHAGHLHGILLEMTGLNDPTSTTTLSTSTRYIFNFPDDRTAVQWWLSLFESIDGSLPDVGDREVNRRLIHSKIKNLNERGIITVQILERPIWAWPTVVFNPRQKDPAGYVLYYHGESSISIAQMDGDSLQLWKELIYRPILVGQVSPKQVSYQHAITVEN